MYHCLLLMSAGHLLSTRLCVRVHPIPQFRQGVYASIQGSPAWQVPRHDQDIGLRESIENLCLCKPLLPLG